jgi:hypothetical protein
VTVHSGFALALLVAVRIGPGVARAEPAVDQWEVTAFGSGVTGGPFSGWGVEAAAMRGVGKYVALGVAVDVVDGDANGTGDNGLPAHIGLVSTAIGGAFRGRLPLGIVAPYFEARLGALILETSDLVNQQCEESGGASWAAVLGVDVALGEHASIGARAVRRNVFDIKGCTAAGGPWEIQSTAVFELGAGLGVRF